MSYQIEESFVQQYSSNVQLLSQQKGSKLRSIVPIEYIKGEYAYVDQIGQTAAKPITTRHADTPIMNVEHARRRLSLTAFNWNGLIDSIDKIKMLNDPTSPYAISAAFAMGRAMDAEIYDAALGTAYTGKNGNNPIVLPNSQKLAADDKGFTFAKLKKLKRMFDSNDIEEHNRYILYTAAQLDDLLGEEKVTSADYNAVRALERGEINEYMGFKFIQLNGIRDTGKKIITADTVSGKTVRHCVAFATNCMKLGIGEDVKTEITPRADKNYAMQVYFEMAIGATRLEEEGVVQFDCVES